MFPPRSSSCWVFLAFGRCFKSDCQSCGLLRAEAVCTMLSSGLSPLFLLLTALELSWSLTDEEKRIILDEHNKYRSQVSPPAVDMLKMVSGFYGRESQSEMVQGLTLMPAGIGVLSGGGRAIIA